LPSALLPARRNQSPDAVRSKNPSKSTLDTVAVALSHKHHSIIRVGAGLIQFVYGSHSRLAADLTLDKVLFSPWFSRAFSLLRWKSVKCQHPWQKPTISRLLWLAVSCGILHSYLHRSCSHCPNFVIVGSGRSPCAPTQPSGEEYLRQHHDNFRDGGQSGTSRGVINNEQLLESSFITCCSWLVPLQFATVFPCRLNFSAGPWAIAPENQP